MSKYLNDSEKVRILNGWHKALRELVWDMDGPGGLGNPDADIVPWCQRLNGINGLCTIQSCAGHHDHTSLTLGHLWLRLSLELSKRFDKYASKLAASPLIERLAKIYMADGHEVVSIYFRGNEHKSLSASMEAIYQFFHELGDGDIVQTIEDLDISNN